MPGNGPASSNAPTSAADGTPATRVVAVTDATNPVRTQAMAVMMQGVRPAARVVWVVVWVETIGSASTSAAVGTGEGERMGEANVREPEFEPGVRGGVAGGGDAHGGVAGCGDAAIAAKGFFSSEVHEKQFVLAAFQAALGHSGHAGPLVCVCVIPTQ